jgi:hypothetical protein
MTPTDISVGDYLILRELLSGILEDHLDGTLPVQEPEEMRTPHQGLTERHVRWLRILDLCATPAALRMGIAKRAPKDAALITLLSFFLKQNQHGDHDRFEWLLTYVFKRRLDTGQAQGAGSVGAQILEMFPNLPQVSLSSAAKDQITQLSATLDEIKSCSTLTQLTRSGLVSKGRELKECFGEERYRPAVLAAVVNYNLVLGRAFGELFEEVAEQNRELAAQLATADYLSNVQPLRRLAAAQPEVLPAAGAIQEAPASRFAGVAESSTPTGSYADSGALTGAFVTESPRTAYIPPKDNVLQLVEQRRLRTAREALALHFQVLENKILGAVNILDTRLVFEEWEARALITDYPPTEKTFRAEFARSLKDASTLLYRIFDESENLKRKKDTEHLRKPHEESLAWLRERGREQVQALRQFAEDTGKRGLPEKQQQILLTALRLSDLLHGKRLRTTADPFGDSGDGSLLTHPDEILSKKAL